MKTGSKIRGQCGAVVIGLALSLLVLVPLLLGIMEFSLILYNKAMITNASREGARAGIVYDEPRLDIPGITSVVNNYCQDHLITFGSDTPDTLVPAPCPDFSASRANLTVTVNYQYDWLVLPSFLTGLIGQVDISAETVMRCE